MHCDFERVLSLIAISFDTKSVTHIQSVVRVAKRASPFPRLIWNELIYLAYATSSAILSKVIYNDTPSSRIIQRQTNSGAIMHSKYIRLIMCCVELRPGGRDLAGSCRKCGNYIFPNEGESYRDSCPIADFYYVLSVIGHFLFTLIYFLSLRIAVYNKHTQSENFSYHRSQIKYRWTFCHFLHHWRSDTVGVIELIRGHSLQVAVSKYELKQKIRK